VTPWLILIGVVAAPFVIYYSHRLVMWIIRKAL